MLPLGYIGMAPSYGWYGIATGTFMASNLDTVPFERGLVGKKVPLVENEPTGPCFAIWAISLTTLNPWQTCIITSWVL